MSNYIYLLSWDVGQVTDPSAVVGYKVFTDSWPYLYDAIVVSRLPLGTKYTVPKGSGQKGQVEMICELCSREPFINCTLAVDQTGVGRAVVDQLYAAEPHAAICPVTIVASTMGKAKCQKSPYEWHVPKVEIVNALVVASEQRRILVGPSQADGKVVQQLRDSDTLRAELSTFRTKLSKAGNEQFGTWRQAEHDDLVLAAAIGIWVAENAGAGWDGKLGVGKSPPHAPVDAWLDRDILAGPWGERP